MIRALLLLVLAASGLAAQALPDTGTIRFDVGGVRVIHRQTNNNLFFANLYLLGGTQLATPATAGLEPFLLDVSERGTRRYPGDRLRRAMARTGSQIGVGAERDWTVFGVGTTTDRIDSTWAIFTDRLLHPTLADEDIEFVRAITVAALAQRQDSPDALLEYLADSVAFAGHPYGLAPRGTAASVAAITRAQLQQFQREQMQQSRMLLVVVGNVPRAKLQQMVASTLGTLPRGDYRWNAPPTGQPRPGSSVHIEARRLPTNYILGWWEGPPAGHADVPALRVASAILSGRLFAEVRSRRNLTYAVDARFRDEALTAGGLYVTTTRPDTTLGIMRNEIRNLQSYLIPTENLRPLIQQFLTEYFIDNESSSDQADMLVRAELYRGDFRAAERFVADLRAVTGEDVQRVARSYFRGIRFAYIGNPAQVNRFRLMGF
ncbi:MAG TPA: pitrilysin family protein [Gemmatimonadaceae bacterium]|nr:pitrilysin family protein [Gemmatimonadaceae bacterium]HRQ76993.1 pitrilysin family protein [Gemmatimonadaceae bacterium]